MKTVFETKQEAQAWYENNCMKCNDVDTCSYHSDVVNSLVTLFLKDATIDEIGVISEGDDYAVLVEECEISDIPKSLIEHNVGITARSEPDCHPAEAISIFGSDLLTQLTRVGLSESEIIAGFRYYGDFNNGVSDNYIDTGFKPADITADNPFEIVFKHNSSYVANKIFSTYSSSPSSYVQLKYSNGDIQFLGGFTAYFTLATIGIYADTWLRFVLSYNGVNYDASLWSIDGTQIGSTISGSLNLINYNIFLGAYALDGSPISYYANQIRELTGNGETWYMQEGSGSKITGSLGTELTVNGTLTNFWQSYNQGKMSENKLILSPVSAPTESDTLVRIFFDKSDNKLKVRYNGTTYILAVET